MRDYIIKKVMVTDIENMWGDKKGRSFVLVRISHRNHSIEFDYEGSDIHACDFWSLCLTDHDIYEEIKWGLLNANRINPAKVSVYHGESGCEDHKIRVMHCYANNMEFFKGYIAAQIHISCMGKVAPRFTFWAADLALLLYSIYPYRLTQNHAVGANGEKIDFSGKYINPNVNLNEKAINVDDILSSVRTEMDANVTCRVRDRRPRCTRNYIPNISEDEPEETCE